jgi:hypothetical protein
MSSPSGYGYVPTPMLPKKRRAWPYVVATVVVAILYGLFWLGWSIYSYKKPAGAFASAFHEEYNQQRFDQIYDNADQRFRDATPKAQFGPFMSRIQTGLGMAHESSVDYIKLETNTGGKLVVAVVHTHFDKDPAAQETFTLMAAGERLTLVGYKVNSKVFDQK